MASGSGYTLILTFSHPGVYNNSAAAHAYTFIDRLNYAKHRLENLQA
jgi:hypothetical protein